MKVFHTPPAGADTCAPSSLDAADSAKSRAGWRFFFPTPAPWREPDLVVGGRDSPYLLRWILFSFRGWQLALHHILRDDDDRALHCHRADNASLILWGGYREVLSHRWEPWRARVRRIGSLIFRKAETPHRLELINAPCWTLWLRLPAHRNWGFWCAPSHWVPWQEFLDPRDPGQVGRGCG